MHGTADATGTDWATGCARALVAAGTGTAERWTAAGSARSAAGTLENGTARCLAGCWRRGRISRPRTRLRHDDAARRTSLDFRRGQRFHDGWRGWRWGWCGSRSRAGRRICRRTCDDHTLRRRGAAGDGGALAGRLTGAGDATNRRARDNGALGRLNDRRGLTNLGDDTASRCVGCIFRARLGDAQRRHDRRGVRVACRQRGRRRRCLAHRRGGYSCHGCRRGRSDRTENDDSGRRSRGRNRGWGYQTGSRYRFRSDGLRRRNCHGGNRGYSGAGRGRHDSGLDGGCGDHRWTVILAVLLGLAAFENSPGDIAGLRRAGEVDLLPCLCLLGDAARGCPATGKVTAHLGCLVLFDGRAMCFLFGNSDSRERVKDASALDFKLTCQIIDSYFLTQSALVPTRVPLALHRNSHGRFCRRGKQFCLFNYRLKHGNLCTPAVQHYARTLVNQGSRPDRSFQSQFRRPVRPDLLRFGCPFRCGTRGYRRRCRSRRVRCQHLRGR